MKEKLRHGKTLELYSLHDETQFPLRDCSEIPEVIEGLRTLAEILKTIHNRLLSEGYVIIGNTVYSPEGELLYVENKPTE